MAALLLSKLSDTGPNVEERSPSILIRDINARAENVLRQQRKPEFYDYIKISLPSTTDNHIKFRKALVDTIQELDNLNIRSAMNSGADWLGAFYEVFLKYANWAQDLGIVLTPRHATRFIADVVDIQSSDIVFDPTCGTGGFLVAAFDSVKRRFNERQKERFKENGLFGVEQDPGVAALAVVNMIFRGDGKNNIIEGDCFQKFLAPTTRDTVATAKYVAAQAASPPITKVMMNPPFALKKGEEKEFKFVNQALAQMEDGGLLFSVLPYSTMVRASIYLDWRKNQLLQKHTLLAVMTLPPDLFYPVGVNTVGVFIKKGEPHPRGQNVLWLRTHNDGLLKSKGRRLPNPRAKNDFDAVRDNLKAFLRNPTHPIPNAHEFSRAAPVDGSDSLLELAPEAYLTSSPPSVAAVEAGTDSLIRETLGFLVKNRMEVSLEKQRDRAAVRDRVRFADSKVNDIFSIESGEVHNASDLDDGDTPLISCGDLENGFVGRFIPPNDEEVHASAFTIAYNGQPFTTKFHPYRFIAKDDVAVARPKEGISIETAFFAAVMLNIERWRYSYGRKCFKAKLNAATIPMPRKDGQLDQDWIRGLVEASPYWQALKGHLTAQR